MTGVDSAALASADDSSPGACAFSSPCSSRTTEPEAAQQDLLSADRVERLFHAAAVGFQRFGGKGRSICSFVASIAPNACSRSGMLVERSASHVDAAAITCDGVAYPS